MALQLTIGGTDFTSYLDNSSVRVRMSAKVTGQTMTFDLLFNPGSFTPSNYPKSGQEVILLIDNARRFGGQLLSAQRSYQARKAVKFQCAVGDYTNLFDRRLVGAGLAEGKTYNTQTAGAMVKQIITDYTTGFTSQGVYDGPQIGQQVFTGVPPSAAISQITRLLPSGWLWYIDYTKDVKFMNAEATPGPVSSFYLDSGVNFNEVMVGDEVFPLSNVIFITDIKMMSSSNDTVPLVGNGITTAFPIYHDPYPSASSFLVTVNGVTQSVSWEDSTDSAAVYVCPLNQGIRFASAPADNAAIVVNYPYVVNSSYITTNTASVVAMAAREGGDGIHQATISLGDAYFPNDTVLANYIDALLKQMGRLKTPGKISLISNDLWLPGHSFTLIGADLYISGLYYVEEVDKTLFYDGKNQQWLWKQTLSFDDYARAPDNQPAPPVIPLPPTRGGRRGEGGIVPRPIIPPEPPVPPGGPLTGGILARTGSSGSRVWKALISGSWVTSSVIPANCDIAEWIPQARQGGVATTSTVFAINAGTNVVDFYRSIDAGATFSTQGSIAAAGVVTADLGGMVLMDADQGMIGVYLQSTQSWGGIWYSNDSGANFTHKITDDVVWVEKDYNYNNWWGISRSGAIYTSANNGATWSTSAATVQATVGACAMSGMASQHALLTLDVDSTPLCWWAYPSFADNLINAAWSQASAPEKLVGGNVAPNILALLSGNLYGTQLTLPFEAWVKPGSTQTTALHRASGNLNLAAALAADGEFYTYHLGTYQSHQTWQLRTTAALAGKNEFTAWIETWSIIEPPPIDPAEPEWEFNFYEECVV